MDMHVDFLMRGVRRDMTDALREYALRRIAFAARRFTHRVRRVTVRLTDENGPRGGVDMHCTIAAVVVGGRRLFVEATAPWSFAAITAAAGRLSEALRRDASQHSVRRRRSGGARPYEVDGSTRFTFLEKSERSRDSIA
ncbi:MAG TPA: HPF/RaiA family ribosome-associated protein [Vicinamibacterales bacterium]|jgi:ribosome-associated translation inhibitor RaiA|nr:HPF/RaiA family ribosome-associated protein [Vicinamibacterales bacterium]